MNVRKFIAANARDALRKEKETLGNDAIILSNRGVPGGVEIMAVAARDMAMIVPPPASDVPPAPARRPVVEDSDDDYRVVLNSARARISQPPAATTSAVPPVKANASVAQPTVRPASFPQAAPAKTPTVNAGIPKTGGLKNLDFGQKFKSPAAQPVSSHHDALSSSAAPSMAPPPSASRVQADVVPMEVMDEIRALRKIVEQHLAGFAWGEAARSEPVKTEVLRQMLDAGFSPQFARDLLAELPAEMSNVEAMAWVKGAADRSLSVIGNEEDIVDRGGVFALVGPTGVGKTTTTAKLAARCVLRHGPSKVALVTTDGYRIGAHEQLRIYGRILGVSVYLVKDAAELRQTLVELQHKHMVLVDTMGMSQKDKLVPELTDMLAGCDVQRLLLLNSISRGDTMEDVVRAYAADTLAGCIISKID